MREFPSLSNVAVKEYVFVVLFQFPPAAGIAFSASPSEACTLLITMFSFGFTIIFTLLLLAILLIQIALPASAKLLSKSTGDVSSI